MTGGVRDVTVHPTGGKASTLSDLCDTGFGGAQGVRGWLSRKLSKSAASLLMNSLWCGKVSLLPCAPTIPTLGARLFLARCENLIEVLARPTSRNAAQLFTFRSIMRAQSFSMLAFGWPRCASPFGGSID